MPEDYIGESDIELGETLQNHFKKIQTLNLIGKCFEQYKRSGDYT